MGNSHGGGGAVGGKEGNQTANFVRLADPAERNAPASLRVPIIERAFGALARPGALVLRALDQCDDGSTVKCR